MDSSFREQGSSTQEAPKSLFVSLRNLVSQLMMSLVRFISLTEEEQEQAGIYRDRPGGE